MKTFILAVIATLFSVCASAQVTMWQDLEKKIAQENEGDSNPRTVAGQDIYTPEAWDTNWDKLINSWYVTHYAKKINNAAYNENVSVSDSVYVERLSRLPKIIELPYNSVVRTCIDYYVDRRRSMVEYMLGLESFYFPMIEETLDKYDLPLELKYLTIVESALNPTALSRAGASGLWQFILPTGKSYGLEINSLIDERRDPVKSTDAACRYLKDLYDTYKDWNLAIAAYNCGGGNVNKAIKRSGGKTDYWAIYPYLPRETRSYLPFFIAANYVMNYYAYHKIYPVEMTLPSSTDTVMVEQLIHFDQIAAILQMDKEEIKALNPQYKRDVIPGNYRPQPLKLPTVKAYAFVELEKEIASHKADELFTNRAYVDKSSSNSQEKIIHRVAKGESLNTIAHRYGVTVSAIRKWNGLRTSKVAVGKSLTLYVNNGGYSISDNSQVAKASKPAKTTFPTTSSTAAPTSKQPTANYKVRDGDSYYTIAKRYRGYTHEDLMKLNNTKNPALKVGQYIKVPTI
ncbi:MAG: transglycosylase SLT domain-containing protein [Dysgonamonadaceae bacterium]|jgi:membrane-bound lytic murein transglycosylase D|nr:transglycosylase SLT domain-containing protein [Dysgonamonadaceae bacterium]